MLDVCIDGEVDAVFPEAEVDTQVVGIGLLPRQTLVRDAGGKITVAPVGGDGGKSCLPGHGRNAGVTHLTITQTELEVADSIDVVLDERLVGNTPGECCGREPSPPVRGGEVRGSVAAERGGEEVAVLERVEKTPEEG